MIKITPMEEFYLKEICKGKYLKEIAQENKIRKNTISHVLWRLKKREKIKQADLLLKFLRNEYKVINDGVKFKNYEEIMASKEAEQLKKIGYTNREIIRELQKRI